MAVPAGGVQRSVSIVVVDRRAAAGIEKLSQCLIVTVLGCEMKRREATKVDSVDEMVFLPAYLVLVEVFVKVFGVDVAKHPNASAEAVPSSFVKHRVSVLKKSCKQEVRKLVAEISIKRRLTAKVATFRSSFASSNSL